MELNIDKLTVALSVTRALLHMMKYGVSIHPANLEPTIASALLRVAGWRYRDTVVDLMCSNDTIVTEAVMASKGIEIPCISMNSVNIAILKKLYPNMLNLE